MAIMSLTRRAGINGILNPPEHDTAVVPAEFHDAPKLAGVLFICRDPSILYAHPAR